MILTVMIGHILEQLGRAPELQLPIFFIALAELEFLPELMGYLRVSPPLQTYIYELIIQ